MSGRKLAPSALATAAALFTAGGAWVLFQQGEGGLVYFACSRAGPPLGVAFGLVALTVCAAAGGLAWRLHRSQAPQTTPTRRFLARVGLGASAIFALASLVMTAAICLVPPCAR